MVAQMKWLITGGAGFIGVNLVKYLNCLNEEVIVVDSLITSSKRNSDYVKYNTNFIEKDIINPSVFDGLKADVVVHLAAHAGVLDSINDPLYDCNTNIIGTINALNCAVCNNAKFIFSSSGAVLGDQVPPVHENMKPNPVSPYGVSKMSAEAYCCVYRKCYNLDATILRFSNVYGPWSEAKNSVVPKFIKQKCVNKPLTIYGDGKQIRDYIYVDDIVKIIVKCSSEVKGELFQIGTGIGTSTNDLASLISTNIEYLPGSQFEVKTNYTKIDKVEKMLGWHPNINLQEGIKKTLEWYNDNLCS
jgi:UDP-glucose 4-epimerase